MFPVLQFHAHQTTRSSCKLLCSLIVRSRGRAAYLTALTLDVPASIATWCYCQQSCQSYVIVSSPRSGRWHCWTTGTNVGINLFEKSFEEGISAKLLNLGLSFGLRSTYQTYIQAWSHLLRAPPETNLVFENISMSTPCSEQERGRGKTVLSTTSTTFFSLLFWLSFNIKQDELGLVGSSTKIALVSIMFFSRPQGFKVGKPCQYRRTMSLRK